MPRIAKWLGDAMEGLMASKMPLIESVRNHLYQSKHQENTF